MSISPSVGPGFVGCRLRFWNLRRGGELLEREISTEGVDPDRQGIVEEVGDKRRRQKQQQQQFWQKVGRPDRSTDLLENAAAACSLLFLPSSLVADFLDDPLTRSGSTPSVEISLSPT